MYDDESNSQPVACEEVLITRHLATLQGNVKSLWHVKRIQGK